MKKWSDIEINTDDLDSLLDAINEHKNFNPACRLIKYWEERMGERILKEVMETHRLPYGFVGDGWPQKIDNLWAMEYDKFNLSGAFLEVDTRDAQDSIYQANVILENLPIDISRMKVIVDIGSGYGRLALPIIYYAKIAVIGVDYTPCGLLIAPQFVNQASGGILTLGWNDHPAFLVGRVAFSSLPAWNIDFLQANYLKNKIDAFCSIHSFQEMEEDTVRFYIKVMQETAAPGAIFYSVNIDPDYKFIPDSWEVIFDRPYPVRDGSYNERMWRIKG